MSQEESSTRTGVKWPSNPRIHSIIPRPKSAGPSSHDEQPYTSTNLSKWKDHCKKFLHLPRTKKTVKDSIHGREKAREVDNIGGTPGTLRPIPPYNEAAAKSLPRPIDRSKWRPPSPHPNGMRPTAPRRTTAPEVQRRPVRNLSIVNEQKQQGDRNDDGEENWYLHPPGK